MKKLKHYHVVFINKHDYAASETRNTRKIQTFSMLKTFSMLT